MWSLEFDAGPGICCGNIGGARQVEEWCKVLKMTEMLKWAEKDTF